MSAILVINAGSSSIKYGLYNAADLSVIERKTVEVDPAKGYDAAFAHILNLVDVHNVTGVGHRIVHGGKDYTAPQKIDARIFKALKGLIPLAPLHQPHNLKPVEVVMKSHPALTQVACFDTAFHRTQPKISQIYALPRQLTDEGIVRYGFHGLSYEFIAAALPPSLKGARVIVAHLGNGSSMCAMKAGKSVATTMGFTPLDGLMMGTRTGAIDPGIILHLLEQKGMSAGQVADLFNKQSGLKGVSGASADMRALMAAGTKEAQEAIDLYCLYAARQAAALTVDLGGVDALVFTAGIGENAAPVREAICRNLAHLGVVVDAAANAGKNPSAIHAAGSRIAVHVIKTDEELMMARHVKAALAGPAAGLRPAP